MKKIITFMALATLMICSFTSCKKNDTPQTTLQKIQGIWILESITTNDHYAGTDHISTYRGLSTDRFDFRTDGNIHFTFAGTTDVSPYSLIGDTKITIDGTDTYDIKTLTSNSFIIYKKDFFGSDYEEQTINWKK